MVEKKLLALELKEKLPAVIYYGLLHYHLRQAGVRSEMDNTALALGLFSESKEINLAIFANINEFLSETGLFDITYKQRRVERVKVKNIDLKELGYDDSTEATKEQFLQEAEKIRNKLIEKIDLSKCSKENPYILHCHNIPLGKNPKVTAAIKLLAELALKEEKALWILNQIHDFPETRSDRLYSLQNCTGREDRLFASAIAYPNLRNVVYAVINSPDVQNLLAVGIDPRRIFLLPDSIDSSTFESSLKVREKEELLDKLEGFAIENGYFFDSNKKILLAPLKVMRRKNIAESILFLNALNSLGDKYQLLITLDAASPDDVRYGKRIKNFIRKNKLFVTIGFGEKLKEFTTADLHTLSEAIITTSVLEGFGFAFHEGWLSNTPVIGRKIPYVTDDFEASGMNLSHMYKRLMVKIKWIEKGLQRLIEEYGDKKADLSEGGFIEKKVIEGEFIDFSDLSIGIQLELIEKLMRDENLVKELVQLNPVINEMKKLLEEKPAELIELNKKVVEEKYGLKAKAKRLSNLILLGNKLYLKELSEEQKKKKMDDDKVIKKYTDISNVKLLF